MRHISVLSGAAALGLGLFAATVGSAQACETVSGTAGGGGSASALQRAGLCPAGVAVPAAGWSRMPGRSVVQLTAAASPFDARAQRGGVHAAPVRIAAGN